MGVPALFRWLSRKYPKIISHVVEEAPESVDGVVVPPDYSKPNPNGELDNLYLDMNGIVHPCTHPEGRAAPETEDEMMLEVFKYTERVVYMARPRKVLVMAIDGVAPRAKMNQQRSRRFRSAQDAKIEANAREQAIKDAESRGQAIDEAIKSKKAWDTNVITPGTPFMHKLALSLRYWVAYKMNHDPGWKDLKVIISDASVPGEGEHKIMSFIRSQRADPDHDPNTTHCIYGLDADLIFLGLASHEPHFRILREDVFAQNDSKGPPGDEQNTRKPFIWLHVDILRQYLEVELQVPRCSFVFDLEKAIDDWVFMCFFVGNDFLPHLPSLDVRDNSIDLLTGIWKRLLPSLGGFMTKDGSVELGRVEMVLQELGKQEHVIFCKRREADLRRQENNKRRRPMNNTHTQEKPVLNPSVSQKIPALFKNKGEKAPVQPLDNLPLYDTKGNSVGKVHMSTKELVAQRDRLTLTNMANKNAAQALRAKLLGTADESHKQEETEKKDKEDVEEEDSKEDNDEDEDETPKEQEAPIIDTVKRKAQVMEDDEEPPDNVRLWEPGYHERYYTNKFGKPGGDAEFRRNVIHHYVEGVCWVLLYYYQGCPSWTWFYPYHYAPFAADFTELSKLEIKFEKGEPFAPYEQLMSVMPASSGHTLPSIFHPLMTSPQSEIIEFYPETFEIDMNGKKMSWQGIALLPFIDETKLLKAVRAKYPELTSEERARNALKTDVLLIGKDNVLYDELCEKIYSSKASGDPVEFNSGRSHGLAGAAFKDEDFLPGTLLDSPMESASLDADGSITSDSSLRVGFHFYPMTKKNRSMLLPGVKLRPSVLSNEDKDTVRNGGRKRYGNYSHNDNVQNGFQQSNQPRFPPRPGFQGQGHGHQGYQGYQAHQGYQGYQGYQAHQGFKGHQGYQGYQGYQGHQGQQGYQGYQGHQGHQGHQGYQGGYAVYQGHQGYQGSSSFQGQNGLGRGGYRGSAQSAPAWSQHGAPRGPAQLPHQSRPGGYKAFTTAIRGGHHRPPNYPFSGQAPR